MKTNAVDARAEQILSETYGAILKSTDRMFGWLMLAQWIFAIGLALTVSPRVWAGAQSSVHLHVYAALILGGLISSLPWWLMHTRLGAFETRLAVACAQMLWSALLIHLSGGRIETHFHVFGSLAILAFYRDVRLLVPATVVVAGDHFVRGVYWPESVYAVANPEWWRFLEHAAWVFFIDTFLVLQCLRGMRELRSAARRQAEVELLSESEREKTAALNRALDELKDSQDALVRNERLAAVGQLAASVGHELRNPLAAVRSAHTYIGKKIDKSGAEIAGDERVRRFRGVVERELDACTKIISDLLDFARGRSLVRRPYSLAALVDESIELVPKRDAVSLINEVSNELPLLEIDRDQFRQVLVNLLQNASEAIPEGSSGKVTVQAETDDGAFRLTVADDGPGMPEEVARKIFQPLFSTKIKGTGLGLPIVQSNIERHGGRVRVETALGRGTTFFIDLPRAPSAAQPAPQEGAAVAHSAG